MPQNLFKELAQLEQVEALALGGSRAGQHFDQDSDYDDGTYYTLEDKHFWAAFFKQVLQ